MGCDIHGFVEVRTDIKNEHRWVDILTDGLTDRWYYLFAKFFGVRNHFDEEIIPLWARRGIPENISWASEKELYNDYYMDLSGVKEPNADWHSFSWVGWWEIKPLLETELKVYYEEGPDYKIFFELMKVLGNAYGDDNVRWLVWFDN